MTTVAGSIRALGAMSGTSMDGVDAAEIVTDGVSILGFGDSGYRAYREDERAALRAAQGRWPGEAGVAKAGALIEAAHTDLLLRFPAAELIGFHGQTLAHDPQGRGTHQAGDGRVLAAALGKPVVCNLRSADVAMGGEGAPLAPFYHFACARRIGASAPIGFLNLGGVGNLTWIDPLAKAPEAPGACLAFDTGPGNAPLDDLMQARCGAACDRDGVLAGQGQPDPQILDAFLAHPHFARPPPKSLDRNDFAAVLAPVAALGDADAAATLTAAIAAAVARGLRYCPRLPARILVTGGGRRNPVLMRMLAAALACPVQPVEESGLDGDMLEAQAFAFLAVRALRGLPTSAPSTTGVCTPVAGGVLCHPDGAG